MKWRTTGVEIEIRDTLTLTLTLTLDISESRFEWTPPLREDGGMHPLGKRSWG
jgi:hypothetical protein